MQAKCEGSFTGYGVGAEEGKGTRKAIFWAPKVWDATFLTCDARLMVSHEILNPKPFKTGDRFVDENNGQFSERPCNGHVRSVCKLKNLESLKNVASLQGRTQCPRKRVVRRLKQLEEAMRERLKNTFKEGALGARRRGKRKRANLRAKQEMHKCKTSLREGAV